MRVRRNLLFLTLVFSAAFSVHAERLPFRTYTTADGLAGDSVRALLQDSRGFLWIATSSGLSRFDGQVFRNYDVADGLPSPRVNALIETRDGTLWVGTTEGVARLDPSPPAGGPLFKKEPLPPGSNLYTHGFLEDRAGRLWIGINSGLAVLDDPSQRRRRARRAALPAGVGGVFEIVEDPEGTLWAATAHGVLRLLADGRSVLYPFGTPPSDGFGLLAVDHAGRLWLGRGDGLCIFQPDSARAALAGPVIPLARRARRPRTPGELPQRPGEVLRYTAAEGLARDFLHAIRPGRSSDMWIGTADGVSHFAGGLPRNIRPAHGLADSSVTAILEDSEGTVWMGTESRGLARLSRSGFVSYGEADGLAGYGEADHFAGERVTDVLEDADGQLYVVIWSRHLHHFDGQRFHNITPRMLAGAAWPGWGWNQGFLRDRKGAWWIPMVEALFRFAPVARQEDLRDARPAAVFPAKSSLSGTDVFRLYEDRSGDLWVSVNAGPATTRLVGGVRPVAVPEIGGVPTGGSATAFAEDGAGDLWVGFYLGGLARLRQGTWRFFGPAEGVPPGFVSDLLFDRAGRLWVATLAAGLARTAEPAGEAPRFERFTTAEGLSTDGLKCLAEGALGHLYIGTSRGVDRLDPATGRVRSYLLEDGLPNSLLMTCHAARDGSLWFGTMNGVARLDPQAEPPRRPPVVLLSGLEIRGSSYPISEFGTREISGLVLAPEQSSLRIDYLAIGLALGTSVLFQYKIEGMDGDWSEPTRARSVAFPRLAPGSYRFLVRTMTRDGLISAVPAAVSFRLLPPVWRRPWFLALLTAFAVFAAWAAYRLRLRRLLAVERMRTRIAADLHDDVGASLARIGLLGDLARHRLPAAPGQADEMLAEISSEARELAETTSDIVWAVDPRKDDLESLLIRLRRFASDLLEAKEIDLRFELPPRSALVGLAPETRRELYLLLKEALHNVARHSRATKAAVRVEIRDGVLFCEVWDDGIGIDPQYAAAAEAAGRRGLVGMRERARVLGGEINLVSAPGEGTRLMIRAPLVHRARVGSA